MSEATKEYFERLGTQVEDAFSRASQDEHVFPEIARRALEAAPAPGAVTPQGVLAWAVRGDLPAQFAQGSRFGQPPVTVFQGTRFVIEVYFWLDGTTSIHEHGFCGAFQVLSGSSLHGQYRFNVTRRINSRFLLGDVENLGAELLVPGAIRAIEAGRAFAHALFHLERPSSTVVIRTRENPEAAPQYAYAPPHVAYDPFLYAPQLKLAAEALTTLYAFDRPRYEDVFVAALKGADIEGTFHLLRDHIRRIGGVSEDTLSDRLRKIVEHKYPAEGAALWACVEEEERLEHLRSRRAHTADPDERFFLAVLLNTRSKAQLLAFVRARFPDVDPVDQTMHLLRTMMPKEGDDDGGPLGFSLGEDALKLVRFILEDVDLQSWPARLIALGSHPDDVAASLDQLAGFADTLRATGVLRPLATN